MTRSDLNRRSGFVDGTAVVRSYPAEPFQWRLVTGADFARSIRWARGNVSQVGRAIEKAKAALASSSK